MLFSCCCRYKSVTTWILSAATEEGTGRGGLQLQLPGSGPPPSLLLLLAAPREGLHPLHLVQESQRPLREARPPGAAAQRQPGRRLRVGEETLPPSLPRNELRERFFTQQSVVSPLKAPLSRRVGPLS